MRRRATRYVMERSTTISWPEVLTDPKFQYKKDDPHVIPCAIADGLIGWANCYHNAPPENFGWGMLKIAEVLGVVDPSLEVLMKLSEEWRAKRVGMQIQHQNKRLLER